MNRNKSAAIYVRVSRAYKEDDERVTIASQLSDCETYCQERGYTIVARYVDKDKYRVKGALVNPSGARKDRPAYLAMLKAAYTGEFDVIVAWKEDRLYRGMYAALPLSEVLDEHRNDLKVELVKETFDRQMLGIKAAIAKLELDNIRDRMIMGRRARIERGEPPGGPIRYGYSKDENMHIFINEAEARVVRQIFEWYISGENGMEIRRRLNASGIPPRKNKIWSKATIHNTLTFEGYATGKSITTLDGEKFATAYPPIISMSVWNKSLEIRKGNKTYRGRNVKEDYLCRGMVVCTCGWAWMVRTSHSKGQTGKCGYYGCSRKDHQPENMKLNCPGTIGAKKLDQFVWDFVLTICKNPDIVRKAIDTKIANLQAELGDIESDAEQIQRGLSRLSDERQWVITTARKNLISEDDMEKQLAGLDLQIMDLRKKHDDKLAAILIQQQTDQLKQWADQYLKNLADGLRVLETDISELNEAEKLTLYNKLGANRFDEKYNHDKLASLKWAILEEKRRNVRMLVSEVLILKDPDGSKRIIPQLAFDIPKELASLVYSHQSLAYIDEMKDTVKK